MHVGSDNQYSLRFGSFESSEISSAVTATQFLERNASTTMERFFVMPFSIGANNKKDNELVLYDKNS
jgi:hypothetical protein